MKKILLILILFKFVIVPAAIAADIGVTLVLDRTKATIADTVRALVKISGTRKLDSPPVFQGADLFHITRGGTSSRIEIVNGKMNAGVDYTFFLQPRHSGSFNVGPARVSIKGKTYESNNVRIVVGQPDRTGDKENNPFFIASKLSKSRVYPEEQSIYTVKLYIGINVRQVSMPVIPEVPGISFKQLGQPSEYKSVHKGLEYHVVEVRYALTPSKEGIFPIGPARMNMNIVDPGRQPRGMFSNDPFFQDFFNRQTGRNVAVTSDPLELEVMMVPEENRPEDFTGLIGKYQIDSTLEPGSIKAGESATLTVTVKGRGNINRIPDLTLPEKDGIKVYADQPVLKMEQDLNGIGGFKTMKWALVPEEKGQIEIPPLSVSYFDPKSDQYRSIQTLPHILNVAPNKSKEGNIKETVPVSDQAGKMLPKQEVKELGRDIMPIHSSLKSLENGGNPIPGGFIIITVIFLPLALYLGAFLFSRLSDRSEAAIAALKARKAAGQLARQCRKKDHNPERLILLVRDYLNDRFTLELGSLTPEEAENVLTGKGVSREKTHKLKTMLQGLENSVYTGMDDRTCKLGDDLSRIIRDIEKEIS